MNCKYEDGTLTIEHEGFDGRGWMIKTGDAGDFLTWETSDCGAQFGRRHVTIGSAMKEVESWT